MQVKCSLGSTMQLEKRENCNLNAQVKMVAQNHFKLYVLNLFEQNKAQLNRPLLGTYIFQEKCTLSVRGVQLNRP